MRTPRVMTSISLRIPESVIESLKEIAPTLGFSGYEGLIKAYISQGLRKDLERLEGSKILVICFLGLRPRLVCSGPLALNQMS